MGDIHFHSGYLPSNRGVNKITQIILGFIISSVLCANWYGGLSCFGEGRIGFVSGLNFVALIANIVILLLNLFHIRLYRLEQFYNVIMAILFLVAIIVMIWFMIDYNDWRVWMIIAGVCIIFLFLLFQWDFKANRTYDDHIQLP